MTDKELRKLRRPELLEILFSMRTRLDSLTEENERLKARLEQNSADREIMNQILQTVKKNERMLSAAGSEKNNKQSRKRGNKSYEPGNE
jgi:hypothetical protein